MELPSSAMEARGSSPGLAAAARRADAAIACSQSSATGPVSGAANARPRKRSLRQTNSRLGDAPGICGSGGKSKLATGLSSGASCGGRYPTTVSTPISVSQPGRAIWGTNMKPPGVLCAGRPANRLNQTPIQRALTGS
jgi:hypothetical protein